MAGQFQRRIGLNHRSDIRIVDPQQYSVAPLEQLLDRRGGVHAQMHHGLNGAVAKGHGVLGQRRRYFGKQTEITLFPPLGLHHHPGGEMPGCSRYTGVDALAFQFVQGRNGGVAVDDQGQRDVAQRHQHPQIVVPDIEKFKIALFGDGVVQHPRIDQCQIQRSLLQLVRL
jgi:hypothetical protein